MLVLAILLGAYSYTLFFFGIFGALSITNIVLVTSLFFFYLLIILRGLIERKSTKKFIHDLKKSKLAQIALGLLMLQIIVNLVGALGPELGFDALWYHLTIPKLWLRAEQIYYIPGNLLYYSTMPKLAEMLYLGALSIHGEILAKVVHYSFGILSCIALFILARRFLSFTTSTIVVVVFYANLVIGWESITGYVDLARTFFEILALNAFVEWHQTQKRTWLFYSACMIGLAMATKLLAIGTLFIFVTLILFVKRKKAYRQSLKEIAMFVAISLVIPLPWFIFSYINTGNPIYPFFTDLYPLGSNIQLLNPLQFFREIWNIFVLSADPVLPIYLIVLPLLPVLFHKFTNGMKIVVLYSFFAILVWYITPRTGGGRFILPYLPAFSLLIGFVLAKLELSLLRNFLIGIALFLAASSIVYRGVANAKYIPVIIGQQSKYAFLSENLNFGFGDFYDTDRYLEKTIKKEDVVLLYGFHNLYYVNFPFIHESWYKKGDRYTYIAIQGASLPSTFKGWQKVYKNSKTQVALYSKTVSR